MKKKKERKKEEEKIVPKARFNDKVDEIIKDYPESLTAHPRGSFEEQLGKHLMKHKVK